MKFRQFEIGHLKRKPLESCQKMLKVVEIQSKTLICQPLRSRNLHRKYSQQEITTERTTQLWSRRKYKKTGNILRRR